MTGASTSSRRSAPFSGRSDARHLGLSCGAVCHSTKGLLVSVFEMSNDTGNDRSILVRIVLAFIGLGIALVGWTLMMTVFLVFIGLPLFIVGLAIAQAQES